MSHGGRVAAAMRSRAKNDEVQENSTPKSTKRFSDLEETQEADHAQRIVKELYHRYEKQQQRWRDYWMLGGFLVFVAWFLATLYLQRSADVAYQVHSTMKDVLDPKVTSMQSKDEIYAWLSNTLTHVWVDPLCGDGICEAPWEFASYSNFGCRADCGQLQNVQNLTVIQIDLKWDFSHPLGSVPASDLLQQALWNLAPFQTSYSSSPYYTADNTFTQLSGSTSSVIDDAPNGVWTLDVKRDIFNKVAGAVRATSLVSNASYWYKNYIAAASVLAEMDLEQSLLTNAATQGSMSLFNWINYTLSSNNTNQTEVNWQVNQLKTASCVCTGVSNQTLNGVLFGDKAFQAMNMSMDPLNDGPDGSIFVPPSVQDYLANYCPALTGSASPVLYEYNTYNITVINATNATVVNSGQTGYKFYGAVPSPLDAGVTYITLYNQLEVAGNNMTKTCLSLVASINSWAANMTRRVQV